jgi:hypothetical protein
LASGSGEDLVERFIPCEGELIPWHAKLGEKGAKNGIGKEATKDPEKEVGAALDGCGSIAGEDFFP